YRWRVNYHSPSAPCSRDPRRNPVTRKRKKGETDTREKGENMRTMWFRLFLLLMFVTSSAGADDKLAPGVPPPRKSTLTDQSSIALTIYNSNIALVKDQRDIEFGAGDNTLHFMDVAAQIIPATVYIKSLSDAQGLRVLEQNYEYDLLNPSKLMEKY